jgi:hypothetical protein
VSSTRQGRSVRKKNLKEEEDRKSPNGITGKATGKMGTEAAVAAINQ